MENVLDVIAEKKAALPRKQRIVAEYMEQNPQLMSYVTLKELSNDLQVTEITVLKTCQSLGYGGFNDIKYEFRKTAIEKRKTDVLNEKNSYTETIPAYESEDERKFLKAVGDNEAQMIARFWEEADIEAIFKAAGMILGKKKIYICGRGISFLLAKCMVDYLYGCNCFASAVNTELNEEVYGVLSELNEDAIMVAVSFPDYYFMTLKLAEFAKKNHVTILAITDAPNAEVTEFADFTLTVPSMTRAFLNTLSAPLFLVNLLTSAVKILKNDKKDSEKEKEFSELL